MKIRSDSQSNAELDPETRLRVLRAHVWMWASLALVALVCGVFAGLAFAGVGLEPNTGIFLIGGCFVLAATLIAMGRKL